MNAGTLKFLLAGSKFKAVGTVLGLLVATVGGAFTLGVVGTPGVAGVENQFGDVNENTTTIESDLLITNPNPIGISLGGATAQYNVTMNDVAMAGGVKNGIAVKKGNSTLHFTTQMKNEKIPAWWISHIENGEHTNLKITADVHSSTLGRTFDAPKTTRSIDTDIISAFNSSEDRPVNANKPFVRDPVAYINQTNASWGSVSETETPIDMRFVVYNPKAMPITITEIGYTVTMNDVTVGEGATDRSYAIPGHTKETVRTSAAIDNTVLDEWWVTHLQNNQRTQLEIDFYAKLDLSAFGGGTMRVPLEELTYTKTIETDLFGSKNASDGANESDSNSETTTAATATETTETVTETTTESTTQPSETTAQTTQTTTANETTDDGMLALAFPTQLGESR